ncbi:Uncharacterized protein Fot_48001 [Forsythia ovata]|uniref:Uncharacterized protein n=1 Tax=Forsythia ovata TaxID=205694 RepID=A0ABD1QTA6_9LAMI
MVLCLGNPPSETKRKLSILEYTLNAKAFEAKKFYDSKKDKIQNFALCKVCHCGSSLVCIGRRSQLCCQCALVESQYPTEDGDASKDGIVLIKMAAMKLRRTRVYSTLEPIIAYI